MFRVIRFFNSRVVATPWWMFALLALTLFLPGALILVFPELLALLAAGFLIFHGVLASVVAWRQWPRSGTRARLQISVSLLNFP